MRTKLNVLFAGVFYLLTSSGAFAQICPTPREREAVNRINQERTSRGLAPLKLDLRLLLAARRHSQDMASKNFFSHTGSDGSSFDQRIRRAGYPSPRSENIAAGYPTASSAVNGWMTSSGHRANILHSSSRHVAVGYAYSAVSYYGQYWTANFGTSSLDTHLAPPVCLILSVSINQGIYSAGQTLRVTVELDNPGNTGSADFYFGVVAPDRDTVILFTNLQFDSMMTKLSDLAAWRPAKSGQDLAGPFAGTLPNFFSYRFAGREAPGTYTLFLAAVHPGALSDGTLDSGDLIAVSIADFDFAAP